MSDDLLLLANGANIVAMQSYDDMRGYFENSLADSITNRKKFRSGLSIHDISRPGEMKEIAFLEMPGFGINRLWWTGGRYAYVAAHFDGFTDHILCIVDLQTITKPEIVARWWLPGMHRAGGETPALPKGKRAALHHMIVAGDVRLRRLARRGVHHPRPERPGAAEAAVAPQLVAALPRRHAHAAAAARPQARRRGGRSQRGALRERHVPHLHRGRARPREPGADRDAADTVGPRFLRRSGTFGPHNLYENRPAGFQSETTIFATYNNAGVRVFDIANQFAPRELASWVPPAPAKADRPAAQCGPGGQERGPVRDARRADLRQRLERRAQRAGYRIGRAGSGQSRRQSRCQILRAAAQRAAPGGTR